ncbi:hypothetical protein ACWDBD_38790 [Streptomyces sp. NPDC001118]|uniref:hypothetical protein n=1 Tax=Streptomyces sp. NPDC001127 TaxID=3154377 RepID=UPI003326053F
MKVDQMAVGMTPHVSAVLEWSTDHDGVRLTLLESGERYENDVMTMTGSEEWGIPGPRDLAGAVVDMLSPTLTSSPEADELWTSARFGLVRWFPAVVLSSSVRLLLESAMEQTVWA